MEIVQHRLTFLAEKHIEPILCISEAQFGQGFLSEASLRAYLQSEHLFCQVVENEMGEVWGFSLMEMGDTATIARKMKSEEAWFLSYFKFYNRIAYRSLTAVAKAAERRGVAGLLVQQGLIFLERKGAQVVVCDAWKSSFTHIGNILERNGYQIVKEAPFYWAADSLKNDYACVACGEPPCDCTAVFYAKFFVAPQRYWWERSDLKYDVGQLWFAGQSVLDFVKNKETPLYIYNANRVVEKYEALCAALQPHGIDFSIYYAMKANRNAALLSHLRMRTNAGIDVCSPKELEWALQQGFRAEQLSYTGTSLSDKELELLAAYPQLRLNLDSLSAVRRFIPMVATHRNIGIRINPHVGMAYNQSLEYSGNAVVKFGIYREQWQALQALLKGASLTVTTVHCHPGSGFLTEELPKLYRIFEQIDAFLELFPTVDTLNMGGGLGVPQKEGDQPLDIAQWAAIVCDYARKKGLKLAFEPGDYLVKDAGILVTKVNTVEDKKGKRFVGIDAGMNMNYEYAYYQMNLESVPLLEPRSRTTRIPTTLSGNINEPIDVFSEDKPLLAFEEGEYIALLNSGGYGASTSSNHCMRGGFGEYIFV